MFDYIYLQLLADLPDVGVDVAGAVDELGRELGRTVVRVVGTFFVFTILIAKGINWASSLGGESGVKDQVLTDKQESHFDDSF